MRITTDIPVVLSTKVEVYKETDVYESAFNTLSIHCNIGSAIITTEYSKRTITSFGNLVVTEDENKKDDNGLPVINVMRRY